MHILCKADSASGRWFGLLYTRMNDDVVQPVGYCSPWALCPRCDGLAATDMDLACAVCAGSPHRGLVHVEAPCPGHPTRDGAYEHITKYVLDKAKWVKGYAFDKRRPQFCKLCDSPATGYAMLPASSSGNDVYFCSTHQTREDLAKAIGTIGDVTSSW